MSIETEKWVLDGVNVWIEDCPDAEPRALCDTVETARAVTMLPEAMALLKDMLGAGGDSDSTTLQPDHEEMARDILRRAGALE